MLTIVLISALRGTDHIATRSVKSNIQYNIWTGPKIIDIL